MLFADLIIVEGSHMSARHAFRLHMLFWVPVCTPPCSYRALTSCTFRSNAMSSQYEWKNRADVETQKMSQNNDVSIDNVLSTR